MSEALRLAREERQPTIVETTSWRLRGHSVVDPASYRTKEEMQRLHDLDPLAAFRRQLIDAKVFSAEQAAAIDADVEIEVNACIAFADESPDPSPDQLFAHAYATPVANAPRELPGLHMLAGGFEQHGDGGRAERAARRRAAGAAGFGSDLAGVVGRAGV